MYGPSTELANSKHYSVEYVYILFPQTSPPDMSLHQNESLLSRSQIKYVLVCIMVLV